MLKLWTMILGSGVHSQVMTSYSLEKKTVSNY
jgi:hypothetical protein